MKIVVCTTCYQTEDRIRGLLIEELDRCYEAEYVGVLIVNTGLPFQLDLKKLPSQKLQYVSVKNCDDRSRLSTSIMWEKINAVREFCDDDTILMNVDDDLAFNPYIFQFLKYIFETCPDVNYFSPILYPGVTPKTRIGVNLAGFDCCLTDTALGGALIARWSSFYPTITKYFKDHNISGRSAGTGNTTFDQEFFRFLAMETGQLYNVYAMLHFSLVQHCNLISTVYDKKKGVIDGHMYGCCYDPRINPFTIRDYLLSERSPNSVSVEINKEETDATD
jgi:hypothetical protein